MSDSVGCVPTKGKRGFGGFIIALVLVTFVLASLCDSCKGESDDNDMGREQWKQGTVTSICSMCKIKDYDYCTGNGVKLRLNSMWPVIHMKEEFEVIAGTFLEGTVWLKRTVSHHAVCIIPW